jgi:hypothetical protein
VAATGDPQSRQNLKPGASDAPQRAQFTAVTTL